MRGTTSRKIVEMVRQAGAREVHMRISSPPTTHSCFYGIDTPERGKLLAARHCVDEMAQLIGADSLAFISLDGLYRALGRPSRAEGKAAFLRRLLHRRLPDRAARHAGQQRPPALACSKATSDGARDGVSALAGQVALVTGASRGIGAAVAVELARRGAHVVITARTQGGLEETDDAIRALGGSATLLPLDLKTGKELDQIGPSLVERFGRLDILVHNAGALGALTPVAHIQPRDWDDVVGVNLSAAWRLIRTCGPVLLAAAAGRAVFVTTGRVPRAARLLGGVRGDEGRDGASGADLGGRDGEHEPARQPVRPGHRRDPHAGQGHAGRGPGAARETRGRGARRSPRSACRARPGTAPWCASPARTEGGPTAGGSSSRSAPPAIASSRSGSRSGSP